MSQLGSTDIAFRSYLRYELFHMLNRLNLMNVFQHFAFSTRTCQINDIRRFCPKLIYGSNVSQKCTLMFKTVKLIVLCCKDMEEMFKKGKYWFHSFDNFISVNETRKHGCLFLKYVTTRYRFARLLQKYFCEFI